MDLLDFLSLDANNPDNIPKISSYIFNRLEGLSRANFSDEDVHNLGGVIN